MGKSRVAPMKYTYIPRLALVAAVLSVIIAGIIKKELTINHVSEYFSTTLKLLLNILEIHKENFKYL